MIDFNNKPILNFKSVSIKEGELAVDAILIDGEEIIACFAAMREKVVFTNKRIITLTKVGLTGNKTDYTTLPYSGIQAFSIETHGDFDSDADIELVLSGLGTIRFELKEGSNIQYLCKIIAKHIL